MTHVQEADDRTEAEVVLAHLENALGEVSGSWNQRADGSRLTFRIFRFRRNPHSDVSTYSTFGLSRRSLRQHDGSSVREELLLSAGDGDPTPDDLAATLAFVADRVAESLNAVAHGEIISLPPDTPLGEMDALIALPPMPFPDSFYVIRDTDPPTAFMLLLPITNAEAQFARAQGWEALENLIIEHDPDIYDLHRPSLRP